MNCEVYFSDRVKIIEEKPCVIEFQAFRGNRNEYILKELVIMDLLTYVVYPFLFKPPFPFKKLNAKAKVTNKWIVKNFHHIDWNEGFIDYNEVDDVMYHFCTEFNRIYTKGLEKRNWIQKYSTANVVDVKIDKEFIPCYNNLCVLGKNKSHRLAQCALKNVYRLTSFLNTEHNCSGGGESEYKYVDLAHTHHDYYSRLQRGNIYNVDSENDVQPVSQQSS